MNTATVVTRVLDTLFPWKANRYTLTAAGTTADGQPYSLYADGLTRREVERHTAELRAAGTEPTVTRD